MASVAKSEAVSASVAKTEADSASVAKSEGGCRRCIVILSLFFRGRLSSAAGGNPMALRALRFLVGHSTFIADAFVAIALSNRDVEFLSVSTCHCVSTDGSPFCFCTMLSPWIFSKFVSPVSTRTGAVV